jgi:hypothetical protein
MKPLSYFTFPEAPSTSWFGRGIYRMCEWVGLFASPGTISPAG